MKIELGQDDYAFVFRSNGQIVLATGESADDESQTGDTAQRIRGLAMQGMVSGNDIRMRSAEIGATALGMMTSPALFTAIMAAIGAAADNPEAYRPSPAGKMN